MPAPQCANRIRQVHIFLPWFVEITKGIEELELVSRFEQRMTLALAVNIDQDLAKLFERGNRYRMLIDIGVAAAGAVQAPCDDNLGIIEAEPQGLLDGLALGRLCQFEASGDAQLVRPSAEQLTGAAFTQEQAERFQQQCLAGPGFAGPGAEARF